jgi:ubiquinone/menaquinone biosynthesis C-methylase UbiE
VTARVSHPLFARMFVRVAPALDREGGADHRRRLLERLSGRVVEVGAGNGRNFAHYPPEVTSVLAVEPEPYLRRLATRSAEAAPVPVRVVAGVAEALPATDAEFDAAVASLVLCSVRDPRATLAELRRVVRPGGELRFYEHVAAETGGLRRLQRVLDATVWPLLIGGCHAGRDTVGAIESAGFHVERLDRFRFPERGGLNPTSPHVLGVAVKP